MTLFEKQSRSKATEDAYCKRAVSLMRRAKRALHVYPSAHLRPDQLVAWAISLRPTLRPPSWRLYKAAIRCYLERTAREESRDALPILDKAGCESCARHSCKTSSRKAKQIASADSRALADFLLEKRWKWGVATARWLVVTRVTGLRPSEWINARLVEYDAGMVALIVANAKQSNGRANGAKRTLDLSRIRPGVRRVIP